MGRAFGAVGWTVVGALIGAFMGVIVGLMAGAAAVGVFKPRGVNEDLIGGLTWAIACGASTVIGGLAGAAGGIVWGLAPESPPLRRFEDDRDYRRRDD